MKNSTLLVTLLSLAQYCYAQNEDHQWMLGVWNSAFQDTSYNSLMNFNFNESPESISQIFPPEYFGLSGTNTAVSNNEGELVCYSNGIEIWNKDHEVLLNGGDFQSGQYSYGFPVAQGALILPLPEAENVYYFISGKRVSFYNSDGWLTNGFSPLHYSIIDFNSSEAGTVIDKESPFITDTMAIAKIVATRHANGRDWWLINNKYETNGFYRYLLNPEGISEVGYQTIGDTIDPGLSQATFSPDGAWYAQFNWSGIVGVPGQTTDVYIDLYQFDRCTGLLSNHLQIKDEGAAATGGVCFSPNSRYLYVPAWDYVYQFDMLAPDIEASRDTVAVHDGFTFISPAGVLMTTRFYLPQLTPDGKIYISCNNLTPYLHVIDQPDSAGIACNVLQHHIELPSYNFNGIPYFPNYHLGARPGSPCDSLSVQAPQAAFGCTPDISNVLMYQFADSSSNAPDTWLWDFGDGGSSSEVNPQHAFSAGGSYEVCLTVSNSAGQDSVCKTLVIQISGLSDIGSNRELNLFPNPAQLSFNLLLTGSLNQSTELRLYNVMGQLMKTYPIASRPGQYSFSTVGLDSGLYFCKLVKDETVVAVGKLVVRD
jgi:PKD domain/Secretion system C-terminal sorting domain